MYNANQEENEILKFWEADKTFEKSVNERPLEKPYVFYDGPPFATGLPHYGHIVASTMKDVVPRYFTMQGYRVERRWGWDCHGLPVENIIEKDLGLNNRKDILAYGVDKFNEACRATVLKYAGDWKKTIKRMGRWVDMENDYKTMDPAFMESVWWVFKQLWEQGLVYKGYKAMHVCPRCSTPLSNFEVTQGYKDVKDITATAKFKLKENNQTKELFMHAKGPVYVLAWTTTPWTLPGNVLLAVNADITYELVECQVEGEEAPSNYLVAKERREEVFKDKAHKVIADVKGRLLNGLEYEPLFNYFADTPNAFRVVTAEFVTTSDGTGVVHIAPGFGEDDFTLGARENVPMVQHVTMDGTFTVDVTDFAGMDVKPKDDPTKADIEIVKWLAHNGKLFSKLKFEHSYPHCWRCDTPLLNYATTSWFVAVTKIKDLMLKNNEAINWVPEHMKEGRFGKWLEGARDWAISRNRYWGTPLPVWESEDGKDYLCFGSIAEVEKLSGRKIDDIHKHKIDDVVIEKNGVKYKRIPEVLDCWFESGSMPYGQMHYPFENKTKFEASFPAEFIAEGQDQTRGWFYTLHILATALSMGQNPAVENCKTSVPAFKNVIVNGIVLAEDGKKMSKKLKNYPDPEIVMEKYGADAMRFYLASSPVMAAEALNFSEAGVREVFSKVINTLYNVVEFYQMFVGEDNSQQPIANSTSSHVLDKWVMAKLQVVVREVTDNLGAYKIAEAARPIADFITELSQWYVRRSRDRFKDEGSKNKEQAIATLREVLMTLSKLMAPFMPFMAEKVWQVVNKVESGKTKVESVHLEKWPGVGGKVDTEVLEQMDTVRKIVELGLATRAEAGVKVRQALGWFGHNQKLNDQFNDIVKDELNVKEVNTKHAGVTVDKNNGPIETNLDCTITPELKKEGLAREVVRTINQMRKESGFTIQDRAVVEYATDDVDLVSVFTDFGEEIKRQTLTDKIVSGGEGGKEIGLDRKKMRLSVKKV